MRIDCSDGGWMETQDYDVQMFGEYANWGLEERGGDW